MVPSTHITVRILFRFKHSLHVSRAEVLPGCLQPPWRFLPLSVCQAIQEELLRLFQKEPLVAGNHSADCTGDALVVVASYPQELDQEVRAAPTGATSSAAKKREMPPYSKQRV